MKKIVAIDASEISPIMKGPRVFRSMAVFTECNMALEQFMNIYSK